MSSAVKLVVVLAVVCVGCSRSDLTIDDNSPTSGDASLCTAPSAICGSSCVDTADDSANCGGCGVACTSTFCSHGKCADRCAPLSTCGSACTDTRSDMSNCGTCGHSCSSPQTCVAGSCTCPSSQTTCGAACADLLVDPMNCGGCGQPCSSTEACVGGSCRSTTNAWPTLGGDRLHSGFNSLETGRPPLKKVWEVTLSKIGLPPIVTDGVRVYASEGTYYDTNPSYVWALSPTDGHTLWSHDFGQTESLGQPTVDSGHVYVASGGYPGHMHSLDATSGAVNWDQSFDSQAMQYWAPLVVGGHVYAEGGRYGGLVAFDQWSGAPLFADTTLEQYDRWSPMFLGSKVYTFVGGNLRAHDALTGSHLSTYSVDWNWPGWVSLWTSPVSDGTKIYVISPPNLYAFLPSQSTPVWTAKGGIYTNFSGMPAVANGVVYSTSNGHLRATDATSGIDQWTFAGDNALWHAPVIAGQWVYVASSANVYAVDVSTHLSVWTAPTGGWLAVAGGNLYVAQSNGSLTAYGLTP